MRLMKRGGEHIWDVWCVVPIGTCTVLIENTYTLDEWLNYHILSGVLTCAGGWPVLHIRCSVVTRCISRIRKLWTKTGITFSWTIGGLNLTFTYCNNHLVNTDQCRRNVITTCTNSWTISCVRRTTSQPISSSQLLHHPYPHHIYSYSDSSLGTKSISQNERR